MDDVSKEMQLRVIVHELRDEHAKESLEEFPFFLADSQEYLQLVLKLMAEGK